MLKEQGGNTLLSLYKNCILCVMKSLAKFPRRGNVTNVLAYEVLFPKFIFATYWISKAVPYPSEEFSIAKFLGKMIFDVC